MSHAEDAHFIGVLALFGRNRIPASTRLPKDFNVLDGLARKSLRSNTLFAAKAECLRDGLSRSRFLCLLSMTGLVARTL